MRRYNQPASMENDVFYKDMTADQRKQAHSAFAEAAVLHEDRFCAQPYVGTREDRKAWLHMESCNRNAAFVKRVAKSQGDAWAA